MMHMRFGSKLMVLAASLVLAGAVAAAEDGAHAAPEAGQAAEGGHGADAGVDWQSWRAQNVVENTASLQRGAANFTNYCLGCHSLKYMRWSRMAQDLGIPDNLLQAQLLPAGAKATDYIHSSFPAADAEAWFGKQPPDLSLAARARGPDWIYQFLKGFVADPSKPTGTNNLVLDGASMPAVLSPLEGVKAAVFAEHAEGGGGHAGGPAVSSFEYLSQGSLTPEQFDGFVRDTVNFLDYVGDPAQVQRRHIGLWVVLFLLVFTSFAWWLKSEYWKDVH
jgi:ubiquinol-cytochrome c reductase cytochrome c1 subunit